MDEFQEIAKLLMTEAPADEVSDILLEADWSKESKDLQMYYCLLFEQFLDNCSVYAYDGWEDGIIAGVPEVEKFFFCVTCVFPKSFDIKGLRRLAGKYEENTFTLKRTSEGTYIIEFRVLRSLLDDIEDNNRRDARKEAETLGYVELPSDQVDQPADDPMGGMGDPMGGMGGGMGGGGNMGGGLGNL